MHPDPTYGGKTGFGNDLSGKKQDPDPTITPGSAILQSSEPTSEKILKLNLKKAEKAKFHGHNMK